MKRIKLVTPRLVSFDEDWRDNLFNPWICCYLACEILQFPKSGPIVVTVTNYNRVDSVRIVITKAFDERWWHVFGKETVMYNRTRRFLAPFFGVRRCATLYVSWERV